VKETGGGEQVEKQVSLKKTASANRRMSSKYSGNSGGNARKKVLNIKKKKRKDGGTAKVSRGHILKGRGKKCMSELKGT